MVATRVSRVPVTGRFVADGTPKKAPRSTAHTPAAPAGDAHGRTARGRDDSALRAQFLALACSRYRTRRRRPRSRGVAGSRPVGACVHDRGGRSEPFLRACDRSRLRRATAAEATCRGHGVRNDHACSRDRSARLPRHSRTPAGCDLPRLSRPGRPGDHSRAATLVQPRLRAGACRLCARGRLAGHARARRVADGICSLLHAPLCWYGGAARVGVRLRARHLAPALPRRRDPLLRPGCACRLGAPTEEAQCRRTSCCPV